jgi:hypothetical protein
VDKGRERKRGTQRERKRVREFKNDDANGPSGEIGPRDEPAKHDGKNYER